MSSISNTPAVPNEAWIACKCSDVVYVDEDYSIKPPPYGTIDKLIESLKDNGCLVAEGKMGPAAYMQEPFQLKDRFDDKIVYGWKPNTAKEYAGQVSVILLGAKKEKSRSFVYYTLASDITKDKSSLIRGYKPSTTDTKTYVMSYENFLTRCLSNLHPICPQGKWLFSTPTSSFLNEEQEKCKKVGQEIFDHYKAIKKDSQAGLKAIQRICEASKWLTEDGISRYRTIERAWEGVGDENIMWLA